MKTLKAFVLFLGLLTLTATQMNAQNKGGLFGRGDLPEYSNRDGAGTENGVGLGGAMTENPTEAPVGGGIAILVVAGVGYTLLKRKEDMQ